MRAAVSSLTLTALKYVHNRNVFLKSPYMSQLCPLHLNTYGTGERPLYIFYCFSAGVVCIRYNLTYKVDPRAERVKGSVQ